MIQLNVQPIPAFDDNYIWSIGLADSPGVYIVDPGDALPVLRTLQHTGKTLFGILITHHHSDHVGGIAQLLAEYPNVPVYGPAKGIEISSLTSNVVDGDEVLLPEFNARFKVLEVPGHTAGHIAFYGHDSLFCGDTVFAGGCGRVFDGTHEQLADSLCKIATLPPQTQLYCAHEYTVDNLGFAALVEPNNRALAQRIEEVASCRRAGQPTVPSTLAIELATNPFMRCDHPDVIKAASSKKLDYLGDYRGVFHAVRHWKDTEYD